MTTLPLHSITRISPLNPRRGTDDVSQLAAAIATIGLKQPLIVWPTPGAPQEYEVLDGGRRWRALMQLAAEGGRAPVGTRDFDDIPVEIHDGDEASARLVALAVSVTSRALHPVDEFEAFAQLVDAGMTVPDVAKAFHETERHVRQRLALAALAPRVRGMWRDGEITREAAEAYTIAPLAAQEALLEDWEKRAPGKIKDAIAIRAALRGDTMVSADPVAKFICADLSRFAAYRERGGRVLEDLFSEQPGLCDPPIAIAVTNDLLRAEAQRVADAEGWGHAFVEDDKTGGFQFALSVEREERLDAITQQLAGDISKTKRKKLVAERDAIMAAVEDRVDLGVLAALDGEGVIYLTRGIALPDEAAPSAGEPASPSQAENEPGGEVAPPGESGEHLEPANGEGAPKPLGEPGKQLLAVIHAGATMALRDAVRQRPDIAMMVTVAALGCQWGVFGLGLRPVQSREAEDDDLLKRIRPLSFGDALAACADASTCDLTVAFARVVAAGIETQGVGFEEIGVLFRAISARAGDIKGALLRAVDRRGFFEAAEKKRTLRVIGALVGPAEAGRVKGSKKDKLAQYAATLSKEQGHLPPPFGDWAAFPARPGALDEAIYSERQTPLAEAMAEAIEADEGRAPSGRAGQEKTPGRDAKEAADKGQGGRKCGPRKTPIEKAIEKTERATA
ncbi:ParB/RepB/Spo0J family partition protein [Methylocystis iwaonis]|uniref:ParB/RepB/Spo0J family partition protein n=1 Tax=Methylocystis iwaonis TaxID=2885079 RepID=UPI002E7C3C12|nr:ParB/RepB/Spo0J family partition protein [Methylocystis iwaonis]